MNKLIKKIYINTVIAIFVHAFLWKFRMKYGISPRKWERLVRRHSSHLQTMLGWEMKYITFIPYKKKRYEDYTNSITHEQKIQLMIKENEQ